MHEIELQEWKQIDTIGAHATTYMKEGEGEKKRKLCIQELMDPAPVHRKSTPC